MPPGYPGLQTGPQVTDIEMFTQVPVLITSHRRAVGIAISTTTSSPLSRLDNRHKLTDKPLSKSGFRKTQCFKQVRKVLLDPLVYFVSCVITVSPACAYIFITTLHQLDAVSRMELQPHWLQQVSEVLLSSFKSIT